MDNINQQLQAVSSQRMIEILEITNSAYYPGFRNIYENVQMGEQKFTIDV